LSKIDKIGYVEHFYWIFMELGHNA